MEAIYDIDGRVVGWRQRAAIFDTAGKPRAFISQRAVFTYEGQYLGLLEDRWYRDPEGHGVAFEDGASGGPLKPLRQPAPAPPIPDADPPPPKVEAPAPPRFRSAKWSELGWGEFIEGKRAAAKG